jgi:hypothetical protein
VSYNIIAQVMEAAAAKAGNHHRLGLALGINPATIWRTRNGIGSISTPLFISLCNYLGWPDVVAIVANNYRPATVEDYFERNKTIGEALNNDQKVS